MRSRHRYAPARSGRSSKRLMRETCKPRFEKRQFLLPLRDGEPTRSTPRDEFSVACAGMEMVRKALFLPATVGLQGPRSPSQPPPEQV